jgi:hypothetical protein
LRQGEVQPDAGKTESSKEFHAACAAVLSAAAAANPGLRLTLGPARYVRWLIAALGAFVALFALFALLGTVAALLAQSWIEALVFAAAALGSGASALIMARSFNPFAAQTSIDARDLAAELLARSDGSGQP